MKNHYELSDDEFESSFKKASLDPEVFTHEAHLRLAWIHIQKYGEEKACKNVCDQLLNYVKILGVEEKYNHTVTMAAVKAVNHFMGRSRSKNFPELIDKFPRLNNDFKTLLDCHYGVNIFDSEMARSSFLEPDLLAFN